MICKHSANNIFNKLKLIFLHISHPIQIFTYLILYKSFYSPDLFANSLGYCYVPAAIQHQSLACTHSNKYRGYVRD